MGGPQEQRAPTKASETQLRKRVSSSLASSSRLAWTCSWTYLSIAIGTKPIPLFPSPVSRELYGSSCASSQSRVISMLAAAAHFRQLVHAHDLAGDFSLLDFAPWTSRWIETRAPMADMTATG